MRRFAILVVALVAASAAVQAGFYEAEAAYEVGRLTPQNQDLFLRVRGKARDVLGISD